MRYGRRASADYEIALAMAMATTSRAVNERSAQQANWFVDPQNRTGNARNTNRGDSPLAPLLDKTTLLQFIGAANGPLAQKTRVEFLSEETAYSRYDIVELDTTYAPCIWIMPTTTLASGTLTGATAKNRALGTNGRQTVTGPNLNTNVDAIFSDTTNGGRAFIRASAGGATAVIASLVQFSTIDFNTFANPQLNPAAGHTYDVLRPGRLNVGQVRVSGEGGLYFTNAEFRSIFNAFGFPLGAEILGGVVCYFCSFPEGVDAGPYDNEMPFFCNCDSAVNAFGTSNSFRNVTWEGGILAGFYQGAFTLDGDALLSSGSHGTHLQTGSQINLACAEDKLQLGISTTDVDVDPAAGGVYTCQKGIYGVAAIWGSAPINILPGAKLYTPVDQTAVQTFPSVVGGAQTIAIEAQGANQARAFDTAANALTAPRALTPANLDATVAAGGFNGYAVGVKGGTILKQENG